MEQIANSSTPSAEWFSATNIGILVPGLGLVTTTDSPEKAMVK